MDNISEMLSIKHNAYKETSVSEEQLLQEEVDGKKKLHGEINEEVRK